MKNKDEKIVAEILNKCLGYKKGDFPVAEKASGEVLSLPIYPELTEDNIELVVREISDFIRGKS